MNLQDLKIDKGWTLFLDRDGVINRRLPGDYVKEWDQFEFLPGVLEAVSLMSGRFGWIIVVSNQQGVGKGLMTAADVDAIHLKMAEEITRAGGRIDAAYFAPQLEKEASVMRKPNPGMALRARREFPGIAFKRSLMAGDSLSDMIFGKKTGMTTALILPDNSLAVKYPKKIDLAFPDLLTLAKSI